ncbi:MAG: hypothetical protein RQ736_10245 [Thiogranum sp.]|nr:hypothetical protein [Thiogranum sp.]
MTLQFIQIPVYWETDEAHTIIAFLEQLHQILLDRYGDRIAEQMRTQSRTRQVDFIEEGDF